MLPYEDAFSLSWLFHLNSEPWKNVAAYNDPHGHMEFKSVGSPEDAVALPPPEPSPLLELAAHRQSCRDFLPQNIELSQLAALLDTGYGITGMRAWPDGRLVFSRTVPSAGGLYPLELYVACERVAGIGGGIHHFNARERRLEPMPQPASLAAMMADLMNQRYLENASAMIFITAVLRRTLRKYGSRGYRYVLMESGHVAQIICLRATELGLATLCVGGFSDHAINKMLKLDGYREAAIYAVAVGHSGSDYA
jgi:SagB-type dehydrogenase family enzyme